MSEPLEPGDGAGHKKRHRKAWSQPLAVTAIVLIAFLAFIGSGSVSTSLEPNGLHVEAPFENDELDRYLLARCNSVESRVVVHHSGGVLVFNPTRRG